MRKKLIAGNWKMNNAPSEAKKFVYGNKAKFASDKADVVLCVPFVALQSVQCELEGTGIQVGAQNMHYQSSGAYTGEVSAEMLKDINVPYVIIGHSERREYYGETDFDVSKKTKKALSCDIIPIVCIGESLAERKNDLTFGVLRTQLTAIMDSLTEGEMARIVIAYEPIWAIGTGLTASNEQAEEACRFIRRLVKINFDKDIADKVRILYGGSVSPDNANELFTMPNIDGGLVGGASLKADFEKVIHFDC